MGTPQVAEFAPAELGAELGMSTYGASALIGDALDLRHRLPLLWTRIRDGEVKPWLGRKTAQATRHLSIAAAALVDGRVAPWADRLTWTRLACVVDAAVIAADPEGAAIAVDLAERAQGVWVKQSSDHGIKDIHVRTEAPNAIWFAAAIDRIADGIGLLGDDSTKDIRRARAVGIIAHPQQTLEVYALAAQSSASSIPAALPDGSLPSGRVRQATPRPAATLYVHLTRDALSGTAGEVVRVEGVGPVTIDQATRWLGHSHVTIKPVLDPRGVAPVDSYQIPDRLREAVQLVSPADVFPFASSTRRGQDLDHTEPYVSPDEGGPPGQTRMGNLGPMTRLHHRIKTHGRWQASQPFPGIHVWRSPHGRYYLVDHTGTRRLPETA